MDKIDALLDTEGGAESVGGGVFYVVEKSIHGGGGDVKAGIRGGVVDKNRSVFLGDPSVAEDNVRNIADPLPTFGSDKIPLGFCDRAGGIVEICQEEVKNIAEPGGGVAHAVGEVQPSFCCFQRCGTETIFEFRDGVVMAWIDNLLMACDSIFHGVAQCPTDATTRSSIYKAILWSSVESVFAIDEFRVEDDIALLRGGGLEVGESLPCIKVARADDATLRDGAGLVRVGNGRVAAFGAEQAVNPAVLVLDQSHVIDVGVRVGCFRNDAGSFSKTKIVEAIWRYGDSEEALSIPPFDPHAENNPAFVLNRSSVECGIDTETFQEMWIGLWVQVVAPLQRDMARSDDGI